MLKLIDSSPQEVSEPRSQASATYAQLKSDIVMGRIGPTEKLKINNLASQLAVSPGAIREALSRLAAEGFVTSRDQRGFTVSPVSVADLLDLTRVRCDIEEVALRRAVVEGDAAWEATVLSCAHRLRRSVRVVNGEANPTWLAEHEAFHHALVNGARSHRLVTINTQLYQQFERYRLLALNISHERDVDKEHQMLVDAALDRDADALVSLIRDHIEQTAKVIAEASQGSDLDLQSSAFTTR